MVALAHWSAGGGGGFVEPPNPWSVVPATYAMAAGVSLQRLISAIGHDGSALLDDNLPEPEGRAGFPLNDVRNGMRRLGWVVTSFVVPPVDADGAARPEWSPELFRRLRNGRYAVVLFYRVNTYTSSTLPVAWRGGRVGAHPQHGLRAVRDFEGVAFLDLLVPTDWWLTGALPAHAFRPDG
jgi:hypothetical protein